MPNASENIGAGDGVLGEWRTEEGGSDTVPVPSPSAAAAAAAGAAGKRGKRGEMGAPPTFLDKLCSILDRPQLADHISWNEKGDGIIIRQVEQFASEVLPRYFKHSNYQSFVRQLNIYGFHKTSHDEHSFEFKQPLFRRDQRHLVALIRRKGQSNTSSSAKQREHPDAGDETKETMARVYGELRRLCNRVTQLEAEMGLIKQRHDTLRLENQVLWSIMWDEGGEIFVQRATDELERVSTGFREMTLQRRQEMQDRRVPPWRSSVSATQPSPFSSMPPPPPPPSSPSPPSPPSLLPGTPNAASRERSLGYRDGTGVLPSSSSHSSIPRTGQAEQPVLPAVPSPAETSDCNDNGGGVRGYSGSSAVGTAITIAVHNAGRDGLSSKGDGGGGGVHVSSMSGGASSSITDMVDAATVNLTKSSTIVGYSSMISGLARKPVNISGGVLGSGCAVGVCGERADEERAQTSSPSLSPSAVRLDGGVDASAAKSDRSLASSLVCDTKRANVGDDNGGGPELSSSEMIAEDGFAFAAPNSSSPSSSGEVVGGEVFVGGLRLGDHLTTDRGADRRGLQHTSGYPMAMSSTSFVAGHAAAVSADHARAGVEIGGRGETGGEIQGTLQQSPLSVEAELGAVESSISAPWQARYEQENLPSQRKDPVDCQVPDGRDRAAAASREDRREMDTD